jgi:hypothetical protein
LTLSSDFEVPATPDPHWQIVDRQGQVYLLDRLKLHEDKTNTSITVPAYARPRQGADLGYFERDRKVPDETVRYRIG